MRAFNRVLSLLLGLALLAGGLLVAAEVAAALLDRGELIIPARRWADELRATTFTDTRVVFGVIAAVGLVLFVAEARPWPKRRIPLADDQQRSWWLLRRSLSSSSVARSQPARRRPVPGPGCAHGAGGSGCGWTPTWPAPPSPPSSNAPPVCSTSLSALTAARSASVSGAWNGWPRWTVATVSASPCSACCCSPSASPACSPERTCSRPQRPPALSCRKGWSLAGTATTLGTSSLSGSSRCCSPGTAGGLCEPSSAAAGRAQMGDLEYRAAAPGRQER